MAPEVAKGFFDRWQTRLRAQFPKEKSVKRGTGLRWEATGAALALLW